MRTLAVALALLLVAPLLPGARAAGSYSVDATMTLASDGHVTQVNTYTYDGSATRWTLLVPPGFSFSGARDAAGHELQASAGQGATIQITTQGANPYRFDVEFAGESKTNGEFVEVDANVAALADSATSARLVLPAGWTMAGWYSQNAAAPDGNDVFRWRGPQLVQMLVAQGPDAPDPRAAGGVVLREANATVALAGSRVRLTYVYDTDVYGQTWKVQVPDDATPTGASTARGAIPMQVSDRQVTLQTPFPFGFHLGARAFWVDMTLPPPSSFGGGFLQQNLSIAAAEGDDVRLHVTLDPSLTLAASHATYGAPSRSLDITATGPLAARVSMLPPTPAGQARATVGDYVVQAPSALIERAKSTAANATELLPSAAGFAGGGRVRMPFYVVYTDADVFTYEEGYYSTGANAISIRADELRNLTDDAAHLEPVSTLVHESTHGLIDRLIPEAPSNLSFLHEGLARLAETHVEAAFPDEIITHEGATYFKHSARPDAKALQERYQAGWTFPVTWGAHGALTNDERGFLYDASGLVWHAYEEAATTTAVEATLASIGARDFNGTTDEQAAAFLLDAMVTHAANLTGQQILYPGAQVAQSTSAQFQSCMGDLVAPPYPFEPTGSPPPGGCRWPSSAPVSPTPATPTGPTPAPSPPALRVRDARLTSAAVAGSPVTLVTQVDNDGDAAAAAVLTFVVDNLERDRRTVQVPAHGTAKTDFAFFAGAAGPAHVQIMLPDGGGVDTTINVSAAPDDASPVVGGASPGADAPGAVADRPGGSPAGIPGPGVLLVALGVASAAALARRKKA